MAVTFKPFVRLRFYVVGDRVVTAYWTLPIAGSRSGATQMFTAVIGLVR